MVMTYPVEMSVTMQPLHHSKPVLIQIGIDGDFADVKLDRITTKHFKFVSQGSSNLQIILVDKRDQEAVVIQQVSFFGITDPKFTWAGVYKPVYPEPWATEQKTAGIELQPQLCPHTYLGWPGTWTLTFDVPVFSWIHKIQDLGWIYD
jgi:hypothetical protein